MGMSTIKINDETLARIKNHIELSGQTITSFIDIAVSNEFKRVQQEKMILSSYSENMAPVLVKAINGTRKNKRK
jgi:hypothetical protein